MTLPADDTSVLDAALAYAALGLAPIPVYGVRPDGRCMCRNPECGAAGKHPIGKDWQKRATPDETAVRDTFRGHTGNIGLAMRGLHIALDFDGADGEEARAEIAPAPTLTAVTGSGTGRHMLYRLEPWQRGKLRDQVKVIPGLDLRVTGHIVVAPSGHHSGGRYRWDPTVTEIAPMPANLFEWLADLLAPKAKVIPVERHRPPAVRDHDLMVRRVRGALRTLEPSVSGSGGHPALFKAACKVVNNGLDPATELELLLEYNERAIPRWDEKDVVRKLEEARTKGEHTGLRERVADRNHAVAAPAPKPDIQPAAEDWRVRLLWESTPKGDRLVKVSENVALILLNDPRCAGRIRFDTFTYQVVQRDTPWGVTRDSLRDEDATWVQGWICREFNATFSLVDVERGLAAAAARNEFSSAREWMDGVTWDGTRRLDRWLVTYLGVEDTEYARLVGRWWLISAVARVMDPGCKADYVLVLQGAQGLGKSKALRLLAGPRWFHDTKIDMGSKDGMQALLGALIVELAELASMRSRTDTETVKAFLTTQVDKYRKPYGKVLEPRPRTCVFAGTTNEGTPFHDPTGNRRYWPALVTKIDDAGIERDREQLWAEAVACWREGAPYYPQTDHEKALCEAEQEERLELDPWHDLIARWLEERVSDTVTTDEIMTSCLDIKFGHWQPRDKQRVAQILKDVGWKRTPHPVRVPGTKKTSRVYRRPRVTREGE